jgi:hypothetical protein
MPGAAHVKPGAAVPQAQPGVLPKQKEALSLFETWNAIARGDGKIPGGLIGQLAESVESFTKYNPTWATTPQLLKMLPRLDASRDWSRREAVALPDELAALQSTPVAMALDREWQQTLRTGAALPPELASAPWGGALPNGLRLAWLLEPRAAGHELNTPLKSRPLIHNAGNEPVVFRTWTFHQGGHRASDASGAEINVNSTEWTTLPRLVAFRLAPAEFVELNAPGIGVGANKDAEDWQNTRVGSWVEAQAGDDVTLLAGAVQLSDGNEKPPVDGVPRWWLDLITARLSRHLPLPADAGDRARLLNHVVRELFGTPPTREETASFVAERESTAVASLAKRIARRDGLTLFSGSLQSGPTSFRVLPVDPEAATRPRAANSPGRYSLRENIRLVVTRRAIGERLVNEASIMVFSPDPGARPPTTLVELKLPDGNDTWATAWVRGGTTLWLQEQGGFRSYDFSNPAQVKEEAAEPRKVPLQIRKALYGKFAELEPKPAPR